MFLLFLFISRKKKKDHFNDKTELLRAAAIREIYL